MSNYILNAAGEAAVKAFVRAYAKVSARRFTVWFIDAENAADDAFPIGHDAVLEIGRLLSTSGAPHTLSLDPAWFTARPVDA
jgi:hypothetical protein